MSEWAVTGRPSASRIDVGVAVVGGDDEQGPGRVGVARVRRLERGDDPAKARIDRLGSAATVASQTPVWPTMSGFAKFATIRS